tara:strand:- start:218 stop:343 length:126 start_codon:yes stop_codon:yes gene_type:complete
MAGMAVFRGFQRLDMGMLERRCWNGMGKALVLLRFRCLVVS